MIEFIKQNVAKQFRHWNLATKLVYTEISFRILTNKLIIKYKINRESLILEQIVLWKYYFFKDNTE